MGFNWKDILGLNELKGWPNLIRSMVAECIGTAGIVFFGCGSAINMATNTDLVQISLAFGMAVFVGVQLAGPVSGGHLNPAVTFGCFLSRRMGLITSLLYITIQCVGATGAAGILFLLTPPLQTQRSGLGANALWTKCVDSDCENITSAQGFGIELITTFVLVLVVLAVSDAMVEQPQSPPLAVGLTVAVCHLVAIPYTGCGLNPARSFGPAIVTGLLENHWVYWAGPMCGSALAALLYAIVFAPKWTAAEYDVSDSKQVDGKLQMAKLNV